MKIIGIALLKYLFTYESSNVMLLERDFQKDKDKISKILNIWQDEEDSSSIILFPEGTLLSSSGFYEKSVEFAKMNNLKQFKHHLQPRTKGFEQIVLNMGDKSKIF